jgi:hypothetical protein
MDRARHELFAGPALPHDENRRPARRRLDDQIEHLLHPRTATDDARELLGLRLEVLAQCGVLGNQPAPLHRVAHNDQDLVVLERLGDIVEGPAFIAEIAVSTEANAVTMITGRSSSIFLSSSSTASPFMPGIITSTTTASKSVALRELEALLAVRCEADPVPLARQQRVEDLAHDFFVVDDQDGAGVLHG